MELKKRKYRRSEVQEIIDNLSLEYQEIIDGLRSEVGILSEKNSRISGELSLIKDREHLIDSALVDAKKQAEEIQASANLQYIAVIESLKKFSENWKSYFKMLADKYPLYPAVQQALEIKDALDKIVKGKDYNGSIETLDKKVQKAISESQPFDPKRKIEEYVAATSDNGFNIDEVLNPGELQLEDLCRELGLMDEE